MDNIQDDVLRKLVIIREPRAKEDPSHPEIHLDRSLSAVDLENIEARDDVCTVHDVPEGSVSFLFQKSSSVLELLSRAAGEVDN